MMSIQSPVETFTTITVKRERTLIWILPLKIITFLCGIFGVIISLFLFCTIIGIPFGLFIFVSSGALITISLSGQKVICPYCQHKNHIRKNALNFKCRKCKQLTVVEWIK
jgi:hypothetical protein